MYEQAGAFFLCIRDAKDTRADGKSRDAYLPDRSNTPSSDSSRPKALTMMNSSLMFTNHASAKWYARLRTTSPMTLNATTTTGPMAVRTIPAALRIAPRLQP